MKSSFEKGLQNAEEEPLFAAFANASDEDMREFLLHELRNDERMASRFVASFGSFDVKGRKKALRSELASIRSEYSHRGFIDYRDSLSFESEYCEAIRSSLEPLVHKGDAEGLFALLETVISHFRGICIDDSNGFVTTTFGLCCDFWEEAFRLTPSVGVSKRIDGMCKLARKFESAKKEADLDWFIIPELYKIPARILAEDKHHAANIIELADERIACLQTAAADELGTYERKRAALNENPSLHTYVYRPHAAFEIDEWALFRLKAMDACGASLDKICLFASDYTTDCSKILLALADICCARGETRLAVVELSRWLVASRPDQKYAAEEVCLRLLDAQLECGMNDHYRDMLATMLRVSPMRKVSAVSLLRRYKKCFEPVAWPAEREKLFARIDNVTVLCDCLAEEGFHQRIYDIACESERFNYRRYENELLDVAPEYVLEQYKESAMSEFDRACDRRGYRSAAKELKHILGLPGGGDEARKLAAQLRVKYPRKIALHDELAKIGL